MSGNLCHVSPNAGEETLTLISNFLLDKNYNLLNASLGGWIHCLCLFLDPVVHSFISHLVCFFLQECLSRYALPWVGQSMPPLTISKISTSSHSIDMPHFRVSSYSTHPLHSTSYIPSDSSLAYFLLSSILLLICSTSIRTFPWIILTCVVRIPWAYKAINTQGPLLAQYLL